MARPAFQPTPDQRKLIEQLAAFGIPLVDMCSMVPTKNGRPIDEKTLRKHFAEELRNGTVKANVKVAQCLFQKATEDRDTTAMIFWLKTRARWRVTDTVELSGLDGEPIKVDHRTAREEFLAKLARATSAEATAELNSAADSASSKIS